MVELLHEASGLMQLGAAQNGVTSVSYLKETNDVDTGGRSRPVRAFDHCHRP